MRVWLSAGIRVFRTKNRLLARVLPPCDCFFSRWCTDLDFGAMLRYMITLCILKISMIQMMD